ncbi:MAG: NADH:flavin oxidoreductase [Bacteroidales bacterium]|nr:MAG: NADH:flavin oxidoreductase [Bacteroidales bacterium]
MKKKTGTSRRKFLQTCTALTILGGRSLSAFAPAESGNNERASKERRDHYMVFSEGHIGNMRLKNRLVRAATAEGSAPGCEFSDSGAAIHNALGKGGVGLIISGHIAVMEEGRAEPTQTCIYKDRFVSSIRKIADVVHQAGNGCKVVAQISHAGMKADVEHPVAPSAFRWPNTIRETRVLSTDEIENIVTHFTEAARRVQEAGFDGIEIHCAHGYLLSSFLSPYTNRRNDKYGGSMHKRVTIVREIVAQVRQQLGTDFPILIKMNCNDNVEGGIDINNFPALANEIAKTGVDAIEVSGNDTCRTELDDIEKQSYYLKYMERLNLDIPVILTGGNKSIELIEEIAQNGKVDFFGFARPFIREPGLPNRWLEGTGSEECTCVSCNSCLSFLGKGSATRCRLEQ